MNITIPTSKVGERVDKFLSDKLKEDFGDSKYRFLISREFVKHNIIGIMLLNGVKVKPSYRFHENDLLEINDDELNTVLQKKFEELQSADRILPEKGDFRIIDQTADYLIINKPHGLVVHPGTGNSSGTLANFVKGYLIDKDQFDPLLKRAGIVHRLDKSVAGLILVAKNREFQLFMQEQFENRKIFKLYQAGVKAIPDFLENLPQLTEKDIDRSMEGWKVGEEKYNEKWFYIRGFIGRDRNNRKRMDFTPYVKNTGSRESEMYFAKKNEQEVYVRIVTGRMHQIRATLAYYNSTVIGDTLYERGDRFPEKIELRSIILGFNNKSEKIIYTL